VHIVGGEIKEAQSESSLVYFSHSNGLRNFFHDNKLFLMFLSSYLSDS